MIADVLLRMKDESDLLKRQLILVALLNMHQEVIQERYSTEEAGYVRV